jgi:tRNA A-37 threonylcarbamoyl transferase component Bud32
LRILSSTTAWLVARCVAFLPANVQLWLKTVFVEWFLPDQAVLKIQKKDDEPEEGRDQESLDEGFDTEVKAYNRLQPLQGVVIPRCYGQLHYQGSRALLLEHLKGVSLVSPEGFTLTLQELSDLLQPCYQALHVFGVQHGDAHLGNFQLVDWRIMVLDFEEAVFDSSAEEQEMSYEAQHLPLSRNDIEILRLTIGPWAS